MSFSKRPSRTTVAPTPVDILVGDLSNEHRTIIGTTTIVNLRYIKECDVYCGRPSKWGNPFVIGRDGTRDVVLVKYGLYLKSRKRLIREAKATLIGKTIGCFCAPQSCHLEILIGCAMELT